MVKRYICCYCNTELEQFSEICPNCNQPWVGWLNEAGGLHEGGCGTMPDGTNCGECCKESCGDCTVWLEHQNRTRKYGKWFCEECGAELSIWLDQVEEEMAATAESYIYQRRHLMWHCAECGCDYENHWETQWGDTAITPLTRKYWG